MLSAYYIRVRAVNIRHYTEFAGGLMQAEGRHTAVGGHLSLQLLDPALGLCKAVFTRYVKNNHRCSSSPERKDNMTTKL